MPIPETAGMIAAKAGRMQCLNLAVGVVLVFVCCSMATVLWALRYDHALSRGWWVWFSDSWNYWRLRTGWFGAPSGYFGAPAAYCADAPTASTARESISPMLYHFHIPKTGGTFLSNFLASQYCHCPPAMPDSFWASASRCECPNTEVHQAQTRCSVLLEHCSFGASLRHCQSVSAKRECRMVTTIRDPVERTISEWRECVESCRHLQKEHWYNPFAEAKRPTLCAHFGMRCPAPNVDGNASLAEFARQEWAQNTQTKLLSGHWGAEECTSSQYHLPGSWELNYSEALRGLESMWLVSTTAQLNSLRSCVRRRRPQHHERRLGLDGDGGGGQEAVRRSARLNVDPDVIRLIRSNNLLDGNLHARASELFREKCGG